MTPQQLKNSILQLAIQGKLVEQRKEEGSAEELYKAIQQEKQKLIDEKKIKREKPLPPITEDEILFAIPDTWKWVRTGDLCCLLDGEKNIDKKYPYLEAQYLRKNKEAEIKTSGKLVFKGDNLILVDGENSGEIFTINEDGYMGSTFKLLKINSKIFEPFFKYFLLLHKKDYRNNKIGAAIPHLNKKLFFEMPFPLPPFAEQKRIVSKIEEILPLIDKYEKAWTKLKDFNTRFPTDMQKSILQTAIQGKLVEQRAEEGTAEELYKAIQEEKQKLIAEKKIKKEKPLPEITEDEIPFDIPNTWKWVRLGSVLHKLTDGTHSTPKYTVSGVPFLSVKDISSGILNFSNCKYISETEHYKIYARCNPEYGDLLLTKVGTTGIPVIVDTDKQFSLFVSVALLKFNQKWINNKFLKFIISSPLVQAQALENTKGIGNKNWVMRDIANTLIPLPPIAEQKRIVEKIEQLLPLCERLK